MIFCLFTDKIVVVNARYMIVTFLDQGIYETKVPLELNAILQIGCVCKVDKTANVRAAEDGWNISELHMKTTAECSYLEHTISYFYLYHRCIIFLDMVTAVNYYNL